MPKLPKERAHIFRVLETYLPEESNLSVLVNDLDTQIIMISCEENLTHLPSCSEAYADGTFKYAPKFFLQLYTIHAYKNGQNAPCVFVLVPDKKEKTYEDMFGHLINIYRERNLDLQFDAIHVDLDQVLMLLLKLFFKILRSKLAAPILHRPGTGRSRKLASQLITKTKILRLAAGSICFSQCQLFRQMKLKTALLKFS